MSALLPHNAAVPAASHSFAEADPVPVLMDRGTTPTESFPPARKQRRLRLADLLPKPRPVNWRQRGVSAAANTVLHAAALLVLSFIVWMPVDRQGGLETLLRFGEKAVDVPLEVVTVEQAADAVVAAEFPLVSLLPNEVDSADLEAASPNVAVPATTATDLTDRGVESAVESRLTGRSGTNKAKLVAKRGGNAASEEAVAAGLRWLKRHQQDNGSWTFRHQATKGCKCSQEGNLQNCPNAATALALLSYLGAGHTHRQGSYKKEVQDALDFLLKQGAETQYGTDFIQKPSQQGSMYTQGIVAIALCEALALTRDLKLRTAAEGAIKFIENAQEPKGGGWRYAFRQPGDTSVVAWQVVALKSGQTSRIMVPDKTFRGVDRFLTSVQTEGGAKYGYMTMIKNHPTPSMTAAGLLCRMYLGWDKGRAGMKKGIAFLDEQGPATDDMYYNYYATQVMHHWGGPEWKRWNAKMRDHLVKTQIQEGHAAGSWDVADHHGYAGGRLYMTALSVLTLEVYYRYLPIYQAERFDLD